MTTHGVGSLESVPTATRQVEPIHTSSASVSLPPIIDASLHGLTLEAMSPWFDQGAQPVVPFGAVLSDESLAEALRVLEEPLSSELNVCPGTPSSGQAVLTPFSPAFSLHSPPVECSTPSLALLASPLSATQALNSHTLHELVETGFAAAGPHIDLTRGHLPALLLKDDGPSWHARRVLRVARGNAIRPTPWQPLLSKECVGMVAPVGAARLLSPGEGDALACVGITTLFPDVDFCSHLSPKQQNRLVIAEVGPDMEFNVLASHRFAALVRAFVVVGSEQSRRIFSFSSTRVSCHNFSSGSTEAQTLPVLWSKPCTGIVRDAAQRDGLVLFSGFAGQVYCLDSRREESLTGPSEERFSTLVYRASVRESVASVQFVEGHPTAFSLTTDTAGFQMHDLRNSGGPRPVQVGYAGVDPLYSHEWLDDKTALCGCTDGSMLIWDTRKADFISERNKRVPGLGSIGVLQRAPGNLWSRGPIAPTIAAMGHGCAAVHWENGDIGAALVVPAALPAPHSPLPGVDPLHCLLPLPGLGLPQWMVMDTDGFWGVTHPRAQELEG